jgi:hypothetical protein
MSTYALHECRAKHLILIMIKISLIKGENLILIPIYSRSSYAGSGARENLDPKHPEPSFESFP